MKKILHITECLGSGVLNYVKNITAWQSERYEVMVAYSTRPETPDNFKEQFDNRVRFIKVKGFTREISPINDLKAYRHIKKIVKEYQPDLIHLHSTKAGVIGRWAINCNKYTVFYSPHAYSFLMQDIGVLKRKAYTFLEKISDRKKCLTIADIDGELEASQTVTKNALCIPNGINPDEMDHIIKNARKLDIKYNKPTISILGKIVPQKNPRLFNQIAELLPECDFIWIGEGPLRECLTSSNITITGWVSRTEAMARILHSDVFIFTSLWESLSIALMEVMYLGKACVVSGCDGNKDIIHDSINGFVCENPEEYQEKIIKLIKDTGLRNSIGENAKKTILEKYNTSVMRERYIELLNKYGL